jgi:hypothetical protein
VPLSDSSFKTSSSHHGQALWTGAVALALALVGLQQAATPEGPSSSALVGPVAITSALPISATQDTLEESPLTYTQEQETSPGRKVAGSRDVPAGLRKAALPR